MPLLLLPAAIMSADDSFMLTEWILGDGTLMNASKPGGRIGGGGGGGGGGVAVTNKAEWDTGLDMGLSELYTTSGLMR